MSAADRVALVTGGSGGIGRGIAARLAAEGATVAVAARRAEGCQETVRQIEAAGGRAEFTVLDVTGAEAVEGWVRDAAERLGRIDWLVNNAGMNGRSARLALENADIPIRANCVCPGPVDTPLMRSIEVLVNPDDPAAARELFAQTTAVKRYGTVEEIADVVHFLLSDAAAYVTGTAVSVDGGVMTGV